VKSFEFAIDQDDERDARRMRGESHTGSLFSGTPLRASRGKKARNAPELVAARVLCRQLPRKRESAEKKRIAHLICLNLLTILKRRSQEA
jgi:hypothetical protein